MKNFRIFIYSLLISVSLFAQTYIQGPALIQTPTLITSAAGTTTLTNASQTNEMVTGITTQSIKLPNATTLPIGRMFYVGNESSGNVTVKYNDASTLQVVYPGTSISFVLQNNGSTNGVWNVSLGLASTSTNGLLSSTDWNTFNNKQAALTIGNLTDAGTDGLVVTGGTGAVIGSGTSLAQHVADVSHNGYLSSTDWSTFNNKGSGTVTAVSIVSTNGFAGSSGGGTTPALTLSTTITGILSGNGTAISAASTTGSGSVVLATSPTMSNPVVGTQTQGDSSTKGASTAYVDVAVANAVAGVNPAVAVNAATTAAGDTSGFTYNNGVSGIGATFTGTVNTAVVIDGFTFNALGQRLLVKNDTQSPSGAFNGVYYVTQLQTGILPPILTRALDFDMPSDMNNTGAIPVISGTVNGTTSWVLTSLVVTVGTTPLTFTVFTKNPASYLLVSNNLSDVASKSTSFNNLSPMTTSGDLIYGGSSGTGTRLAAGSNGDYLTVTAGVPAWTAVSPGSPTAPTVQIFTSGSGTYTPPSPAPLYIKVRMVGGGGGGGSSNYSAGASSGSSGSATTFGSSYLTANGGAGGGSGQNLSTGAGGTGGTATISMGTGLAFTGASGQIGMWGSSIGDQIAAPGGNGGSSPFGGASGGNNSPTNAAAGTGSGGGGGTQITGGYGSGAGGGAGGYIEIIISSPTTYSYSVGSGGAGAAGVNAGANGASGIIYVEEFYQ